jgi:hypothetical protein
MKPASPKIKLPKYPKHPTERPESNKQKTKNGSLPQTKNHLREKQELQDSKKLTSSTRKLVSSEDQRYALER